MGNGQRSSRYKMPVHEPFEVRPAFICARLHRLVPGRSWVLVGRATGREWLRFLSHKDRVSVWAEGDSGDVRVHRKHVLATWVVGDPCAKWGNLVESKTGEWKR